MKEHHVLILGAYGLVGFGVAKQLSMEGNNIIGFGRCGATAHRVLPDINWVIGDLRTYSQTRDWHEALEGITAVVNCSGALQDGPDDDLEVIHHHMVAALAAACAARDIHLVQISAVGAALGASTRFLSSKARGDAAIRASGVRYNIFRPGLILAPHAYGGTALLRMLAAIPAIQPVAYPGAQIQTVSLSDVSHAVALALSGAVPEGCECDLVEGQTHSLQDVVTKLRRWLGFGTPRIHMAVPDPVARAISKCADGLAWLGWNSPLRTTGVQVLRDGIKGDPSGWDALHLRKMSSLDQTLGAMHPSAADRLSARLALLTPLIIATLSLFWCLSGLIALAGLDQASGVLEDAGWQAALARRSVVFWAVVDLALGVAILIRKFARLACWAMVGTSIFYLISSSVYVPQLWLDPLGPLLKILPAILLALVARVVLENR